MSQALPSIGEHCALPSCNLNDFLPIRCHCQHLYCTDHINPDVHDCPIRQSKHSLDSPPSLKLLARCAAQGCKLPSLESFIAKPNDTTNRIPAVCSCCAQAFCPEHREPSSHSCSPLPSNPAERVSERNAAAKVLLAIHFGSSTSTTTACNSTASASKYKLKKEAQSRQIVVMKMRRKAQPGDTRDIAACVSVDHRLHLKVSQAAVTGSERIFWFRKTVVTGRALDLLATHFKMTISDTQPLKLVCMDGGLANTPLRTDLPLGDQVFDGAFVALTR